MKRFSPSLDDAAVGLRLSTARMVLSGVICVGAVTAAFLDTPQALAQQAPASGSAAPAAGVAPMPGAAPSAQAQQAAAKPTFLDERGQAGRTNGVTTPAGQASAQPAAPVVMAAVMGAGRAKGFFRGSELGQGWDQPAPASEAAEPLAVALSKLLPPTLPAHDLDSPAELIDMPVKWRPGQSRQQALAQLAADYGISVTMSPRRISIRAMPLVSALRAASGNDAQSVSGVPAPTAAAPSASPTSTLRPFDVKTSDVKLASAFARWANASGVRIRWDAEKHVLIGAPMTFMAPGVFEAVAQALSTPGIINSEYPLEVCEYPNQPVLIRITRLGDQGKECSAVMPAASPAKAEAAAEKTPPGSPRRDEAKAAASAEVDSTAKSKTARGPMSHTTADWPLY